jgi:murein DD-endopeptidase MepM/ murein hydrolase activator NlpD
MGIMKRILGIGLLLLSAALSASACAPRQGGKISQLPALPLPRPRERKLLRTWNFASFPESVAEDAEQIATLFSPSYLPSIWPVRGRVSSEFGWRISPTKNREQFHEGLDIAAPLGSPILASADGIVSFSGYKEGYGRTVILNHGHGLSSLYAHLSKCFIKAGGYVERGEKIASVGKSGETTGPHLHYEVRVQGNPTDPMKYGLER